MRSSAWLTPLQTQIHVHCGGDHREKLGQIVNEETRRAEYATHRYAGAGPFRAQAERKADTSRANSAACWNKNPCPESG
jgi:hypothetical protein